jgi:hypothetical protein
MRGIFLRNLYLYYEFKLVMSDLVNDIKAYERMQGDLEAEYTGKWVLVCDEKLISVHNVFEKAAEEAVHLFGAGPYLIRQVGAHPLVLPASVMYRIR